MAGGMSTAFVQPAASCASNYTIADGVSNTLRLHGANLARLQELLDAAAQARAEARAADKGSQRRHHRWPFRHEGMRVDMQHPGGALTSLLYVCRNVSGSGIGLLHNAYVHVGTRCVVYLPHPRRGPTAVPGVVARCQHYQRTVHDIGIRFRDPVDMGEYLELDPFEGKFSLETVEPAKLHGSILHVDDSAIDRRLLRHLLAETQLTVTAAENAAEAFKRSQERYDLIVADVQLPGETGIALCERLRDAGVRIPVLLLSADTRQQTKQAARACGAAAFLAKPITRQALLPAIGEFLLLEGGRSAETAGAIHSTLPEGDPLRKFLPEFVAELRTVAERLRAATKAGDPEAVRRECFQIIGAASTLGLEPLGKAAYSAMVAVTASMSTEEAARPIRELTFACERVRERAGDE